MLLGTIFLGQLILLFILSRKVNRSIYQLILKIFKDQDRAVYLYSIFFLPGTFIHEVSHFLAALFLVVPVSDMVLIPKAGERSIQMGEVKIAKVDLVRSTLVGLAPFIFGLGIIVSLVYFGVVKYDPPWYLTLIGALLIFEVANTMFLSTSDIKSALKLIILIAITLLILYLFGVRYSVNLSSVNNPALQMVIKNLALFFLIPIGLDVFVILMTTVLGKIGKVKVYVE